MVTNYLKRTDHVVPECYLVDDWVEALEVEGLVLI